MPRQPFEEYCSDEELFEQLDLLNALNSEWSPWRNVKARKEHEDLFGELIQRDEVYFKRKIGVAWDDVLKLSRLSMERILLAIFADNAGLEDLAQKVNEIRRERLRETFRRHSPVDRFLGEWDADEENN
ncbi:hypothetical protein ACFLYD_05310 [Chloroflexota bacterium]